MSENKHIKKVSPQKGKDEPKKGPRTCLPLEGT